jgi:hypothetical protein
MSELPRIDSQRLKQWADTVSARTELPRLIRRLILETGRDVVQLGFPAGEGVSTSGWDGSVRATVSTPFVPAGLSVWELSVNSSPGKKAEEDYAKRSEMPDGSPTEQATYMAVSLRRWSKRGEWALEKVNDSRWASVRALGVDDIETWLEEAPVTNAWLADELELAPYGLRAAEAWWRGWSASTDPPLPVELVLAGRDSLATAIAQTLAAEPSITTIAAASVEEVQAFLAAMALHLADEFPQLLPRLAFVDSVATWRALQGVKQPLVLVPIGEEVRKEVGAGSGHHVLVPLASASRADHELPPVDPAAARVTFEAVGIADTARLENLSHLARRSLLALRRTLAAKPELHSPGWARPPASRVVRAALLAGAWNALADGDRAIVADLAGLEGEDLREELDALAAAEDPLVGRLGESWAVTSPYDAWSQLHRALQDDDLRRLEKAVQAVLLETDPALTFPPEERWRASFTGTTSEHSASLKTGLAESILLLAVNGDEVADGRGAAFATYLVRILLEAANFDPTGKLWSSLAPQLPRLAEAAPDAFLDAVREGMTGDRPVVREMFTDPKGQDALFRAGSAHVNLLWALESVAWSPRHFGLAVDVLASLAEIDPGGSLSNRPSSSLHAIFCPWHPENSADNAGRLAVIDALRSRHPQISWDLMLSMLPESHGVHMPTSEPTFRDWKPPRRQVTYVEYFELVGAVAERVAEDASSSGERWAMLIERGADLPPEDRAKIRARLTEKIAEFDDEDRALLWESIRSSIARNREFADADWALPAEELDDYEMVLTSLSPSDALARVRWLFEEQLPDLDRSQLDDVAGYEEELVRRRAAAIEEIESERGLEGVLALASGIEQPGIVGWALAAGSDGKHDGEMLGLLDSADASERAVSASFFSKRFSQDGWVVIETLLADRELSASAVGRLLLATHFPRSWELAEERGPEVEAAYWAEFWPYRLGPGSPHVDLAARKLMDPGRRPAVSLRLLGIFLRRNDDDGQLTLLVAEALDSLLEDYMESGEAALEGLSSYDLTQIFGHLEAHREVIGIDRLGRLEWSYLGGLGHDPTAPTLFEILANDPQSFVRMICSIYKEHSVEDPPEPTDAARRIAQNAYQLLSAWARVPGEDDDGKIEESALRAWIDQARDLLAAADRREVGDSHIGNILARARPDTQDDWPPETVRNLLEELQSKRIESGIAIQKYNSRGVVSKSIDTGGEAETELAERYESWAEKFQDRWPRSAAVLRDLGGSYRRDAREQDAEAEQRRRGFGR